MCNNKRKILFFEEGRPNNEGGFGGSLYSLIETCILLSDDFEVYLHTYYEVPILETICPSSIHVSFSIPFSDFCASVSKTVRVLKKRPRFLQSIFSDLSLIKDLKKLRKYNSILENIDPDIVIGNNQITGNFAVFVSSLIKRIPYYQYQRAEVDVFSLLKLIVVFNTKAIISISKYVNQSIVSNLCFLSTNCLRKNYVIYNFDRTLLDDNFVPKTNVSNLIRIVWLGRIIPQKNIVEAIEIVFFLKNKLNREVRLDIYGSVGDNIAYYNNLQECIKCRGLINEVVWNGYRSLDEILTSNTPVFLLHTTLPSKGEPFGRVLLDGIKKNVIVLTNGAGGAKEVVENNKNGYVYSSIENASYIINELNNDLEKYNDFVYNAKQYTKKTFCGIKQKQQYLELFD